MQQQLYDHCKNSNLDAIKNFVNSNINIHSYNGTTTDVVTGSHLHIIQYLVSLDVDVLSLTILPLYAHPNKAI